MNRSQVMFHTRRIPFHQIPQIRRIQTLQTQLVPTPPQIRMHPQTQPSRNQPRITQTIRECVKELGPQYVIALRYGHCVYQKEQFIAAVRQHHNHLVVFIRKLQKRQKGSAPHPQISASEFLP